MSINQFYAHKPDEALKSHPDYNDNWDHLVDHIKCVEKHIVKLVNRHNLPFLNNELPRLKLIALLHDIGKIKPAFQAKLRDGTEKEKYAAAHTPIAVNLINYSNSNDQITEYIIGGHHAGLPDGKRGVLEMVENSKVSNYDDLSSVIEIAKQIPDFLEWLNNPPKFPTYENDYDREFVTRFLFSIFTTADHDATREYVLNAKHALGGSTKKISGNRKTDGLSLKRFKVLKQYIQSIQRESQKNATSKQTKELLQYRKDWIKQSLLIARTQQSNFFSMDLPTGGGKTLTGLAFCYRYAITNKLKRVIYVAPYLNIIEQTTKVIAKSLGIYRKNNYKSLLEHHSNGNIAEKLDRYFQSGDWKPSESEFRYERMIEERWRQPFIVTTMLQFLESLFSNKVSRTQKLANLSNSILFFDEYHMIPIDMRKDAIDMFNQLARFCNCTFVLGSATQTPWQKKFGEYDIKPIVNLPKIPATFRRVKTNWHGELNLGQLPVTIMKEKQTFCIVNLREVAQGLAVDCNKQAINSEKTVYCLTTLQNKKHRKRVLRDCHNLLSKGLPVTLISTQSIEAGVDIDFPIGYRQLAPLESIIQTAGRVNREGRLRKKGILHLFDLTNQYQLYQSYYQNAINIVRDIVRDKTLDLYDQKQLDEYYEKLNNLYKRSKEVIEENGKRRSIEYCRRNQKYHLIADNTNLINEDHISVLAPADSKELQEINDLNKKSQKGTHSEREQSHRKLYDYTVSMYASQVQRLVEKGMFYYIPPENSFEMHICNFEEYDKLVGIKIPPKN